MAVAGYVWKLSRDAEGCRAVQNALEGAGSDQARAVLAAELRGHIWEALRCPHANYVLQKCITTMRPQASQFIIDELQRRGPGAATQAARHRFGCRILERLLEHCLPSQVRGLVEALVGDAVSLASHPYGNYVVQHILEHGAPDQQARLAGLFADHVLMLGSDSYASAVVAKALTHGSQEGRVGLAQALLKAPGLLPAMAHTRHGHVAAKFVLQLVEEDSVYRE
eukprot:CAMPEP_0195074424 /NCGR_PEP_ID=MMETSP0448-20130528/17536_1 /TAXON_ID=66468 /ORGANISM="Heterocapsa triquestra, Strain CCMP 448" /LENGTH=223 /DNA_ID=CAMNT_0040106677 /DNA_START=15 /DNA_END=683 /DNA_ORIENTATION=-